MHRRQISGKWWEFQLTRTDKKEEKIAKRFKIVLAEKPASQEAAKRSRNKWQNDQKQKK